MIINKLTFEGTPEEFERVRALFTDAVPASEPDKELPLRQTDSEAAEADVQPTPELVPEPEELTPELVERALSRISLSESQKQVLQAVLNAGEEGIIFNDLAQAVGVRRQQLAGLISTLQRRVEHTDGWPKALFVFEYAKEPESNQFRYWLPDAMREVLLSGRISL